MLGTIIVCLVRTLGEGGGGDSEGVTVSSVVEYNFQVCSRLEERERESRSVRAIYTERERE